MPIIGKLGVSVQKVTEDRFSAISPGLPRCLALSRR